MGKKFQWKKAQAKLKYSPKAENEKGKQARRSCCYQFPYFNLGRIYVKKKMFEKACEQFRKSLEIDPSYEPALEVLELLKEAGIKET